MIKFFKHIRNVIPTAVEESLIRIVEISRRARHDNSIII